LGEIARRHEVLRSVFPLALGRPSQVLLDRLGLALPRVDLRLAAAPQPRRKTSPAGSASSRSISPSGRSSARRS